MCAISRQTKMPLIGLGTWELRGKTCTEVVRTALDLGYRHIDTAFLYENHKDIAKALQNFPREELFITSKFLPEMIETDVEALLDLALKELKTDYLDLFLIHWPQPGYPLVDIFSQLHALTQTTKLCSAGVSNYDKKQLKQAYDAQLPVPYNQVEFHPYLYQKELLTYCNEHHTQLVAYRSLGKGALLEDPLFIQLAQKYNRSPAQIILRWCLHKNVPVIPKAKSEAHLKENLSLLDFALSPSDIAQIDSINKNRRYCK